MNLLNWLDRQKIKLQASRKVIDYQVEWESGTYRDEIAAFDSKLLSAYKHWQWYNKSDDRAIYITDQNGHRGIAYVTNKIEQKDFLMVYLLDIVQRHKTKGYVLKVNQTTDTKDGGLTYHHYLKPSPKLQNTFPIDQIYGNVSVMLEEMTGNRLKFKITNSYYSDHLYQNVRPFDEWVGVIFRGEPFDL